MAARSQRRLCTCAAHSKAPCSECCALSVVCVVWWMHLTPCSMLLCARCMLSCVLQADLRQRKGQSTPRDKWITPLLDLRAVTGAVDPDQERTEDTLQVLQPGWPCPFLCMPDRPLCPLSCMDTLGFFCCVVHAVHHQAGPGLSSAIIAARAHV